MSVTAEPHNFSYGVISQNVAPGRSWPIRCQIRCAVLARCLLVRLQDRVDKLLHRFQLRLPPYRRLALGTQECAETYVVGPARKESTAPLSPKCQVYFVDISLALYYFTLGIEQTRFTKPDEKYHSTRSFPGGA